MIFSEGVRYLENFLRFLKNQTGSSQSLPENIDFPRGCKSSCAPLQLPYLPTLGLVFTLIFSTFSHQHPLTPQDTAWKCDPKSKHCSKTIVEFEKNSTDCLTSFKVCQLICDDYASLWPKPSKLRFNKKFKPIDVGTISFNTEVYSMYASHLWFQLFVRHDNLKYSNMLWYQHFLKAKDEIFLVQQKNFRKIYSFMNK